MADSNYISGIRCLGRESIVFALRAAEETIINYKLSITNNFKIIMFLKAENFLKAKNSIIISIVFIMAFSVLGQVAAADSYGLDDTAEKAFGGTIPITDTPATIIGKVVGSALAFVGILFLILMIYGGITWMMARGNEQEVTKAKDLIISAVVGLIIVLSAYAITAYIGGELTI